MHSGGRLPTILLADDDAEDCLLLREALLGTPLRHELRVVPDGEELLDYLYRRGRYAERQAAPRPDLVLVDLNMPKRDGREVLRELKSDPAAQRIPIVILTTSTSEDDVAFAYAAGARSYITKPATFQGWAQLAATLAKYWFELARIPQS